MEGLRSWRLSDEGGNMKILIVDDDKEMRDVLKILLLDRGYEVVEAINGRDGLEKAAAHNPDLIVSDALMPDMDGFHFLRNIKEGDLRHIPFVFYTAIYSGSKDKELALSLGAAAVLNKTGPPEKILAEIDTILQRETDGMPKMEEEIVGEEEFLKSYGVVVEEKLEEKVKALEREIEERKRIEERLYESEERFRAIAETAIDAIISLKAPDIIYLWNKKAEEIFGYKADEIIGKNLHDIIVPEKYREKAKEGIERFFQTGQGTIVGKTTELSALRKDGTEFPVEISISEMRIKNEWHATGIVRDITRRKEAEEALKMRLDEERRLNNILLQREFRIKELKDENAKLKERIEELEKNECR